MADQSGTDAAGRSPLDQAAADSITPAEPPAAREIGVNRRLDPEVQAVDGRTASPAPLAGARRRLSPRPVPVSRRRRAPAQETTTATDEEPTPAEEMDDVGTHDEKAAADKAVTPPEEAADSSKDSAGEAGGRGATATATKSARPKTAAEIVAEQRAREKAAAESSSSASAAGSPSASGSGSKDPGETAVTKPVARVSSSTAKTGAAGNKTTSVKTTSAGKSKQALSSVGSGVRRLRNLIASLIWLAAVIAAAVLALGALFTALDQTNQSNEIVRWVLERGHDLVGPFKDLFRLETAKNTLLVNWGIAALVYLIAGKILERFVRP
ncbi:hypothetical protein AB0F43_37480 [Kribbella sp. NPDC023972]|uniref:hypothetical protein n=1 Tax=Kribbella sp. NPDC023972 TaxID=3154795 RepID=UPI0033D41489